MNFEDIKDNIVERAQDTWGRIQESDTYVLLEEKYQNLTPNGQKLVNLGVGLVVFLLLYSIPSSYVKEANFLEESFDSNRTLTRELIQASRLAQKNTKPVPTISAASLKTQVEQILKNNYVLDKQKKSVSPMEKGPATGKLVPKGIDQAGIKANITKLNLAQIVKIGEDLSNINGAQLINLAIQADGEDNHYFNVEFEVAAFSLPQKKEPDKKGNNRKSKSKKK